MYSDEDIIRIGKGLQDYCLPRREWTHAAHVAAAVWLLDQYGDEAFDLMPEMIRNYNLANGVENTDSDGYHHTITIASLKAIRSVCSGASMSLADCVERLLLDGYGEPSWLLEHYSKAYLMSPDARRTWVEPDLWPLPDC